jgi:uncharacterized protein (TIGR04222 family)
MNPFELYGPEFLVFYSIYGLIVIGLLYAFRHYGEADDGGKVNLSDPGLIAYLRGGKNEALRVTTVFLIDRGLLTVQGDRVETRNAEDAARTGNEMEKAILHRFSERSEARSLFADELCEQAADRLRVSLERLGLLPDDALKAARTGRLLLALAALWVVALIKIVVGLKRDRPVGFLLVVAAGLAVVAWTLYDPLRTGRGEALLSDLKRLFAHLRNRATLLTPSTNASEAAMLAAVFGVAALPEAGWLHAHILFPRVKKRATESGSGSSSCGAGCGSSSGSSCGSSCGGGGGGGGCGGCGS